jgi:Protein of unknown function (DUF1573)
MNTSKTFDLRDSERVLHAVYLATRCVIGALLLTAGLSKLFPPQALAITPTVQIPVVVVSVLSVLEIVTGCVSLSGARSRLWHFLTLCLFGGFLATLFVRWSVGSTTCKCYASLEFPIAPMFLIDGACLVSLIAFRSRWTNVPLPTTSAYDGATGEASVRLSPGSGLSASEFIRVLALAMLGLSLFSGWARNHFGSVSAALTYASGAVLFVEKPIADLGAVPFNEPVMAEFTIRNISSREVTIAGADADCGCFGLLDLPRTLAPSEVASMRIRFTPLATDVGEVVEHMALLILNVDGPPVVLKARAHVVGGHASG